MRYYGIKILDPETRELLVYNYQTNRYDKLPAGTNAFTYGSLVQGQTSPNALDIELDIMAAPYGQPGGNSRVTIWGISIGEINQSSDLNNKAVEIYGGMQKGLPLATAMFEANQSGLLASGLIFQAFGNWIGVDMTLDLILRPDDGSNSAPKNLTVEWPASQPLATAIRNCLTTAFPDYEVNVNIRDDLVLAHTETGYYRDLNQLAQWMKAASQNIIGGTYAGVDVTIDARTITVYDRSTRKEPKQIRFIDMIGQPTWIGVNQIQITCMLRADIKLDDEVRMPAAVVTTTAAASSSLVNLKSAFEGVFWVSQVRHSGQYRNPDAAAWVTTINAVTPDSQPAVVPPR